MTKIALTAFCRSVLVPKISCLPPLACCLQGRRSLSLSADVGDDLLFTEEHRRFQETIRKVVDREINPYVDDWEAERTFPAHTVFKKLGEVGVFGVDKDPEYGGLGLDYSFSIAMAEALGHIKCGGIPMAVAVQTDMATPSLAQFGSDWLKQEFLKPTISGDVVACLGVSEVQAGSDVSAIRTTAVSRDDDLVINGGKMWTTNGTQADWMCLLANTGGDGGLHANKSLICLPMNLPGIHVSKKIEKLGMRSSDTAEIFFEDVRVSKRHVIGEMGQGFLYQMLQFQNERLTGTAISIPPLETLIQDTIEYARNRQIFGQSVLDHQVVHFRLAELQTELEALRSLLYRAVVLKLQGQDVTRLASMCKLKAGRLARELTDSCLQYWGGMGFTEDCSVSRYFRDFRLLSIGAGADEVMLNIICKYMGTLPKRKP